MAGSVLVFVNYKLTLRVDAIEACVLSQLAIAQISLEKLNLWQVDLNKTQQPSALDQKK
ncbi:hypothetical protein GCM10009104_31350 [Marinobacterium maritimum]|uniref:Uncharacterized protein n=1 Tax=Marinobacterium maritimum TaxID=500162 RepID=A0ABN1IAL0_9GAMM